MEKKTILIIVGVVAVLCVICVIVIGAIAGFIYFGAKPAADQAGAFMQALKDSDFEGPYQYKSGDTWLVAGFPFRQ